MDQGLTSHFCITKTLPPSSVPRAAVDHLDLQKLIAAKSTLLRANRLLVLFRNVLAQLVDRKRKMAHDAREDADARSISVGSRTPRSSHVLFFERLEQIKLARDKADSVELGQTISKQNEILFFFFFCNRFITILKLT